MFHDFFSVARRWITRNKYPTEVRFKVISARSDTAVNFEYVR